MLTREFPNCDSPTNVHIERAHYAQLWDLHTPVDYLEQLNWNAFFLAAKEKHCASGQWRCHEMHPIIVS